MTRTSLLNADWAGVVERLGGAEGLRRSAQETGAFQRVREIKSAVDLLRLVLAYCLGKNGLRLTAAWAAAAGLADISNVALLKRLRRCGDWLTLLIGRHLAAAAPAAGRGRLIRIVDATAVPQAGAAARKGNKVWRVHSAFDLPAERFGWFELTDQHGGEQFDRIPVIAGEIRLGDRAYLQPDRLAAVLAAGGDFVVRAGWKGARWRDGEGAPLDLIAALRRADPDGLLDRPIWIARDGGPALALRLVALKKPPAAAEAARREARRSAQRGGHQVSQATLTAADWVILVTSLPAPAGKAAALAAGAGRGHAPDAAFSTADVLALYRLRWRIELAFKRLKSLVGLKGPPGGDPRSARTYVLAHLLMILLLEPLIDELEVSPRSAQAA